ncbi:hypothetical protein Tco_1240982 [Tanacetum coccineum]
MKEVVKKEIIKLLDAGIIYPIEDSPWVSPVHYVPKKGGMTVVTNEKNEKAIIGWRVCIDYHHSTLKYLFAKQDAKPRLIRWILLLQEFDIDIKNKKGAENVTANHLSRLENPNLEELRDEYIDDNFPDETLTNVSSKDEE